MNQHISRLDTNTDDPGQPPNHGVGPGLRLLLQSFLTSVLDLPDLADNKDQPRMSRCSSAKVFGGSGMPSGVSTVARRSAALRRVGLKLRMPSRARVDFIRFTIRVRSPTRHSRSRLGRLASSS